MDALSQSLFGGNRRNSVKPSRIQYVGDVRDRTQQFLKKREELRNIAEKRTKDNLEQLAKWFASSNARASGGLFHSLSWSSGMTNPQCLYCGTRFSLLVRKYPCKLCEKNFCSKCIKRLNHENITGVLNEEESLEVCARCAIIVTREEDQRKFNMKFANNLKQWMIFVDLYESLRTRKDIILKLSVQYEYLASSIKDPIAPDKKPTHDNFSSVYESASNMEKELLNHFKQYDKDLKQIIAFSVQVGSRAEKLKKNIQMSFVSVIQENLPAFKKLKQSMTTIELNTINNLYLVIHRLCMENMKNKTFWTQYGEFFMELLKAIRSDLIDAVAATGEKWDDHKKSIGRISKHMGNSQ